MKGMEVRGLRAPIALSDLRVWRDARRTTASSSRFSTAHINPCLPAPRSRVSMSLMLSHVPLGHMPTSLG